MAQNHPDQQRQDGQKQQQTDRVGASLCDPGGFRDRGEIVDREGQRQARKDQVCRGARTGAVTRAGQGVSRFAGKKLAVLFSHGPDRSYIGRTILPRPRRDQLPRRA